MGALKRMKQTTSALKKQVLALGEPPKVKSTSKGKNFISFHSIFYFITFFLFVQSSLDMVNCFAISLLPKCFGISCFTYPYAEAVWVAPDNLLLASLQPPDSFLLACRYFVYGYWIKQNDSMKLPHCVYIHTMYPTLVE